MMYAIVAMTEKTRAIGRQNAMLYHLPKDLKYFQDTTRGHSIVMGYRTYLSLPKRPLPQRKNIVLSRQHRSLDEGVILLHSIEDLLAYHTQHPEEALYICGGADIYEQCMPCVDQLLVTVIEEEETVEADAFFPKIDTNIWEKTHEECVEDTKHICFTVWKRKQKI